ncbi:protein jag [Luteipulveratus mongoliensis]|uniref:R3H domain-containing protein n=1 Tax=Luteipulveratus mongoliensis TaxID=571913 RepID=A0A0K1JE44_9MICO|nr:R3H domain-containing nucleic acid-binding protein [Luteipulveratus mongoliensis]AKU14987.1 hypothetical protein VV02_02440 [Luteipulveratus mongoliensis]
MTEDQSTPTHDVAADADELTDGLSTPETSDAIASIEQVAPDADAEDRDEQDDEISADAQADSDGEPDDDGDEDDEESGDESLLEREGEVAADFLETLLDIADLDGDIDVDIDGDRAAVSIVDSDEGRVPRRLVGDGGKVLDALQELTRLAVQAETGDRSRLMLDVAGYRADRRAELVKQAEAVVETVRTTGESAPLEPMTAFERKVVHDAVLAAGLSSESEGAEPRRYVVVLPAS